MAGVRRGTHHGIRRGTRHGIIHRGIITVGTTRGITVVAGIAIIRVITMFAIRQAVLWYRVRLIAVAEERYIPLLESPLHQG